MTDEPTQPPAAVPAYPLQDLIAALWDAGWKGEAPRGWLFHAHVAAERQDSIGPVTAILLGRLDILLGPALAQAARLICRDHEGAGPRQRTDLDVAENAVRWTIQDKARSERLRRTMGLG